MINNKEEVKSPEWHGQDKKDNVPQPLQAEEEEKKVPSPERKKIKLINPDFVDELEHPGFFMQSFDKRKPKNKL